MSQYVPVPVIIPVNNEPEKCPSCGKKEEIISVCKHCGYEYVKETNPWYVNAIIFITILFIFYLFLTALFWLANDDSLIEVLKNQWVWISDKRIF